MCIEKILSRSPGHVVRVLIEGQAGMGKSTLCHKICYDWASRHPQATYSDDYDLMILVSARHVQHSVLDYVIQSLLPHMTFITKETLMRLLQHPELQERTLMIVDGYDEMEEGSKELMELLRGSLFGRSSLCMMSRPAYAADCSRFFDAIYVTVGFSKLHQREFVGKYVNETMSSHKVLRQLELNLVENSVVSEISRTPLYLWFICMMMESTGGRVPDSRTQLYRQLLGLLVRKVKSKDGPIRDKVIKQSLKALAWLAYEAQINAWTHINEEAVSSLPDAKLIKSFGLLTAEITGTKLYPCRSYSFVHKTLQEFLCAMYIEQTKSSCDIEVLYLKHKANNRWQSVWIFLSGLLADDDKRLRHLFTSVILPEVSMFDTSCDGQCDSDLHHSRCHLGLQCLAECGLFKGFEDICAQAVPVHFVFRVMTCHYCLRGFTVALGATCDEDTPSLVLNGVDLETYRSLEYQQVSVLAAAPRLPSIIFTDIISISLLIGYLTHVFSVRKDIGHLYIYLSAFMHPELEDPEYDPVALRAIYTAASSLRSLVFVGSQSRLFKGAEQIARGIDLLLSCLLVNLGQNLHTLILREHIIVPHVTSSILVGLSHAGSMKTLIMEYLSMKSDDYSTLSKAISVMAGLQHLCISHCSGELCTGVHEQLPIEVTAVIRRSSLTDLAIHGLAHRDMEVMKSVVYAFRNKPSIVSLDLAKNCFKKSAFCELMETMPTLRSLQRLCLQEADIKDDMVQLLAASLAELPSLQYLNLSGNPLGTSGYFSDLCRSIADMVDIQGLHLDHTAITDNDLFQLRRLFRGSHLRELSIVGNLLGFTDCDSNNLFQLIQGSTSLEVLQISCCLFNVTLVDTLCQHLGGNRNLQQLFISCYPSEALMSAEAMMATQMRVRSQLSSLTAFSLEFTMDILSAKAPSQSIHDKYNTLVTESEDSEESQES